MTPQEIFDQVYSRIIAQGAPATDDAGNCVYQAEDGKKCAVGVLMTPEELKVACELKGNLQRLVQYDFPGLRPLFTEHFGLLIGIQSAHDGAARSNLANGGSDADFIELFDTRMRALAYVLDLKTPD